MPPGQPLPVDQVLTKLSSTNARREMIVHAPLDTSWFMVIPPRKILQNKKIAVLDSRKRAVHIDMMEFTDTTA